MDFRFRNQRSRKTRFPEGCMSTTGRQEPMSFAQMAGIVALAFALGYFFMVMLELDMQDARKKRAALPFNMSEGRVEFVTPSEVATRKFSSMSQVDQHCVTVGTGFMQAICPRTTGFVAAAMEDFQRIGKDEDDDL